MNKTNLLKLRDELIPVLQERGAPLYMTQFRTSGCTDRTHECKTACCLIGYSSELLSIGEWDQYVKEHPKRSNFWERFSDYLYELKPNEWDFIFSSVWPNSFEYAVERLNHLIQNEGIPTMISKPEALYPEYEGFPWIYDRYLKQQ